MEKKLSVVIPAYNEAQNLEKGVLGKVRTYLEKVSYPYEVIIVDDGSIDETVLLVEKEIKDNRNFVLIKNKHGGKAAAVISGFLLAKGDIALFTDMDQATPISEIEKFFPEFENGVDIVIGSRAGRKGAPILRKLAATGFAMVRSIFLGLYFIDTQCGFKAFNKKSREAIFQKIKNEWGVVHFKGGAVNAGFDVELLYLAKKLNFRVEEVGVEWNYVDTERVQVIKDSLAAIYDIFRIIWNDLSGKYR